jgi:hypothetical protein
MVDPWNGTHEGSPYLLAAALCDFPQGTDDMTDLRGIMCTIAVHIDEIPKHGDQLEVPGHGVHVPWERNARCLERPS